MGKETEKKTKTSIFQRSIQAIAESLETEEVLWNNEIEANRLVERILYLSALILFITPILNQLGVYKITNQVGLWILTVVGMVIMLVPALYCASCKGKSEWIGGIMLTALVLSYAVIDSMLTYRTVLTIAIPTILSARYFNKGLTIYVQVLSTIAFAISAALGPYLGMMDLNYISVPYGSELKIKTSLLDAVLGLGLDPGAQQKQIFLRVFMPKYFMYILVAICASAITIWGYRTIVAQAEVSHEHARVETELTMASGIQQSALPKADMFDGHPNFDLAAKIMPAKEVGGDFYDFFFIDPTHLALMVADVSGKGVPAALFMMISKLLLDNSLSVGRSPAQALAEVNRQLCEKNMEEMFVTVWIGVLDLESGELVTANGGHEYPVICRKNGDFEVYKDKHGLVLGGMENVTYTEEKLTLCPGDTLFVYTDGVPEATNDLQEQFRLDRAVDTLTRYKSRSVSKLLEGLYDEIEKFQGDAPQFDDITMVALRLKDLMRWDGWTGRPNRASVPVVANYVESTLIAAKVPEKAIHKVNICVDEIYSNTVRYSGATWAHVICMADDKTVTVVLEDSGAPFDPLSNADPDIELSLEERQEGGLGIFMVRKLMDKVEYQYVEKRNSVTLTLKL